VPRGPMVDRLATTAVDSTPGSGRGAGARFWAALARTVVAVALMTAIALLAQVPMGAEPTSAALRLSLRAPASIQECRERSAEELAALPAHRRAPTVCETVAVSYRLRVAVDDVLLFESRVQGTGLRRERPLVVYKDLPLLPGRHRLEAALEPEPGAPVAAPAYRLRRELEVSPGQVALVTLRDGDLRLVSPID
jgi:hypothetical protein